MNEQDFPALYRAADELSIKAQTHFFKVLFLNLFLLVGAAALSVFNVPYVEMAYAQAFVLLISLGCAIYLGVARPEKNWYSGRALAESVKTVTWRYMMRAEPYNVSDSDARRIFVDVLKKLVASNGDVSKQIASAGNGAQVTDPMISTRASSFASRKETYRQGRISDQQAWYQKKAKENNGSASRYFIALCAANILAIIFSLLKIRFPDASFWPTDIFVAIAGAILAWAQAKRYRELSASYSLTANEISLIREQLFEVSSEIKFSEFVGDAENAFSREHTQWIARRDG